MSGGWRKPVNSAGGSDTPRWTKNQGGQVVVEVSGHEAPLYLLLLGHMNPHTWEAIWRRVEGRNGAEKNQSERRITYPEGPSQPKETC